MASDDSRKTALQETTPYERPQVPSVSGIVVVATNDFARAEFPKLAFWNGLVGDPKNVVVDINGLDRSPAGAAFIEKGHVNRCCLLRCHDSSLRQAGTAIADERRRLGKELPAAAPRSG